MKHDIRIILGVSLINLFLLLAIAYRLISQ